MGNNEQSFHSAQNVEQPSWPWAQLVGTNAAESHASACPGRTEVRHSGTSPFAPPNKMLVPRQAKATRSPSPSRYGLSTELSSLYVPDAYDHGTQRCRYR